MERDDEGYIEIDSLDDDEGELWLYSYSDMITDLLAVFVLLFSFAMLAQGLQKDTQTSFNTTDTLAIVEAHAGQERDRDTSDAKALSDNDNDKNQQEQLAESIREYIEQAELSGQVSMINRGENVIVLRVADKLLFESGKSDVNAEAKKILESISLVLQEHIQNIELVQIEGHTDNRPINNSRFASNWELSADRAVKVLRTLLQTSTTEFDSAKFVAAGYGEHHPIDDNTTDKGRENNRRVDFVIQLYRNTQEQAISSN